MSDAQRIKEILAAVKLLAVEYYTLTQKPLGVTGEIAEYVAAEKLGLTLANARTAGYDAIREIANGPMTGTGSHRPVRGTDRSFA